MMLWTGTRLKLIEDWQQSWRWSSMRFIAIGGAIQAALLAPQAILQYVPQFVLQTAATISFVCIVLAAFGRVTQVEKKDVGPDRSGGDGR